MLDKTVPLAELDYAYLADFAQVSDGKITSVGASFTHVRAGQFPGAFPLSVAGRIRVDISTHSVALALDFSPEDGSYNIHFDGLLETKGSRPYRDKVGLLFAFSTQVPLPAPGLYSVKISVEGNLVRTLKFDVE